MTLVDRSLRRQFTAAMALAMALALLLSGTALAQTTSAAAAVVIDDSCNNVPDAGFPDVSGQFVNEINCLAAYGITQGKADGTYDPTGKVRRWQMALFIHRLATAADAQLAAVDLPTASDQGFTDISDVDAEAQDAINVLAEIGVVQGKTTTAYAPFENIRRDQMASFINRLQGYIQEELGGDAGGFVQASNHFPDVDSGNVHNDNIHALYGVGIVEGFGDGTYGPGKQVTRQQMSLFIMRHFEVNVNDGVLTSLFPPDGSGSNSGVVVDVDDKGTASSPGEYEFVADGDDDVTDVNIDDDDEFTIDGDDATLSAFIGDLSVADDITVVEGGAASGTAGNSSHTLHELTNVDPADITSGYVGNVDDTNNEIDIIEPVSGVALRSDIDYDGQLYKTDGDSATKDEFEDDVNEGDHLDITGDTTLTFALQNKTVSGTVMDPATAGAGQFRIGELGDDPDDGAVPADDDDFESGATDDITVDGDSSDKATFDAEVTEGDEATYKREDDQVTITLENEAPSETEGTVVNRTGDLIDTGGDMVTIIDDDGDDTTIDYAAGTRKLNGSVASVDDLDDALTAGDHVVFQPADAGTSTTQQTRVTDEDLEGYADDYVAPVDPGTEGSYDAYLTQKGAQDADADLLLQDDVEFTEVDGNASVGNEDDGNNDYFVEGDNVNLLTFTDETEPFNIVDTAEDHDPIRVIFGNPTDIEHHLDG